MTRQTKRSEEFHPLANFDSPDTRMQGPGTGDNPWRRPPPYHNGRLYDNDERQQFLPPVKLDPGWEGTDRPPDELNFRTLERVEELERNQPRDRCNLVYFIMFIHGVGILMPWNMFINAKSYFEDYKLNPNNSTSEEYFEDYKLNPNNSTSEEVQEYRTNFMSYIGMAAQYPNFLMSLVNLFLQCGGKTSARIVTSIIIMVFVVCWQQYGPDVCVVLCYRGKTSARIVTSIIIMVFVVCWQQYVPDVCVVLCYRGKTSARIVTSIIIMVFVVCWQQYVPDVCVVLCYRGKTSARIVTSIIIMVFVVCWQQYVPDVCVVLCYRGKTSARIVTSIIIMVFVVCWQQYVPDVCVVLCYRGKTSARIVTSIIIMVFVVCWQQYGPDVCVVLCYRGKTSARIVTSIIIMVFVVCWQQYVPDVCVVLCYRGKTSARIVTSIIIMVFVVCWQQYGPDVCVVLCYRGKTSARIVTSIIIMVFVVCWQQYGPDVCVVLCYRGKTSARIVTSIIIMVFVVCWQQYVPDVCVVLCYRGKTSARIVTSIIIMVFVVCWQQYVPDLCVVLCYRGKTSARIVTSIIIMVFVVCWQQYGPDVCVVLCYRGKTSARIVTSIIIMVFVVCWQQYVPDVCVVLCYRGKTSARIVTSIIIMVFVVCWQQYVPDVCVVLCYRGKTSARIVTSIIIMVFVFIFTVILAMIDTSEWPALFFWLTLGLAVILNSACGFYQNSMYGIAAILPMKYTNAIIFGNNFSGTFVASINILAIALAPDIRTSAIYYFVTAIVVLLIAFDAYFVLPITKFFRHFKLLTKLKHRRAQAGQQQTCCGRMSVYFKVFKQIWVLALSVWFVFFVSLALFPQIQSDIKRLHFPLSDTYWTPVFCFLSFNLFAMLGNLTTECVRLPGPRFVWLPVLLRSAFIPVYLLCNFRPDDRAWPVLIDNDYGYIVAGALMAFTGGYFSSLCMMYAPKKVDAQNAGTAGMMMALFLALGILSGVNASRLLASLIQIQI
ncbi:hypothetical protein ACOMHN_035065 [Nucella lapillus]